MRRSFLRGFGTKGGVKTEFHTSRSLGKTSASGLPRSLFPCMHLFHEDRVYDAARLRVLRFEINDLEGAGPGLVWSRGFSIQGGYHFPISYAISSIRSIRNVRSSLRR